MPYIKVSYALECLVDEEGGKPLLHQQASTTWTDTELIPRDAAALALHLHRLAAREASRLSERMVMATGMAIFRPETRCRFVRRVHEDKEDA